MDPTSTIIQEWGAIGAIMIVLGGVIAVLWKAYVTENKAHMQTIKDNNDKLIVILNQTSEAVRGQTTATTSLGELIKNLKGGR